MLAIYYIYVISLASPVTNNYITKKKLYVNFHNIMTTMLMFICKLCLTISLMYLMINFLV